MNYIETIRAEHGDVAAKIAEEAMQLGASIASHSVEYGALFATNGIQHGHEQQLLGNPFASGKPLTEANGRQP